MGLLSFRRERGAVTLHDELRHLEERARNARAAYGATFSRSLLARESGVAESTLAAWIDQGRVPQESGKLMDVVRVLSNWTGSAPANVQWQDLWAAARKSAAIRKGGKESVDGSAQKSGAWARRTLAAGATAAALALVTGLFSALGVDIHSILPFVGTQASASPATAPSAIATGLGQGGGQSPALSSQAPVGGPASVEDFHARANWCCQISSVVANTGFYWPGTASSLSAALHPAQGGVDPPALTPAGLGLIEIPVQTSGTAPILVAPPKVIVRSRGRNLKHGIIAILPRGGQGGGSAGQFEADVDNAAPVTVPFGTGGSQASTYQYVSGSTPEVITLYVADTNYDCTFDIRLTWQEQGRTHTIVLSNGGKHFRIIGSIGLPWYHGDPRMGDSLKPVPAGQPFSRYAPGVA